MTLRRLLTAGVLALLWLSPVQAATTLLPNGKQCFATANGVLSGGSVFMYIPSTTTFKQTWQDANQTTLNSNPIILDANGCATIYGVGSYRQLVQDSLANTVWDQLTTDASSFNNVFWAGTAGGTPNVITVIDPSFSGQDGTIISFVAPNTNTGSTTLNASGFGAIPLLKDSPTGPVALTGSEIVAGNIVNAQYSLTANAFHILNLIGSAASATPSLCGASGLKITNSVGNPSLIANILADQIVMTNTQGLAVVRNSININLNLTLSGVANGIDTGSDTPNTWYNVYAIDNGITTASLASTSATAPTMPSGYSYRCRLGAMRVDGSGNLLRTLQYGADARWVVTAASNTLNLPSILGGPSGNPSTPTFTSVAIAGTAFAPPTTIAADIALSCGTNGATQTVGVASPNSNYGAFNTNTAPPLMCDVAASGIPQTAWGRMFLETNNISFAASNASVFLFSVGWRDKINAN